MLPARAGRLAVLLGAGVLCFAAIVHADEPLPSSKAAPVPPGAAGPGAAAPQTRKLAPAKGDAKDAAKRDPRASTAKSKAKKSLIAPPGLLLQAPSLRASTAPGLGKLDLNRATLEQLQSLSGVGLTWAPRILAGRPYRSLGDLARDGIPFTTIDALSQQVELGP
jgi:DNA uptake protein ComE-like DNA-binding protein